MTDMLNMPIVYARNAPPGKFILIGGTIYTSMTTDQLLVKMWIGHAIKAAKTHLAQLVADAERRLNLRGCCTACDGYGVDIDSIETNGKCWDCYGTGHCHDGSCS